MLTATLSRSGFTLTAVEYPEGVRTMVLAWPDSEPVRVDFPLAMKLLKLRKDEILFIETKLKELENVTARCKFWVDAGYSRGAILDFLKSYWWNLLWKEIASERRLVLNQRVLGIEVERTIWDEQPEA